MVAFFLFSTFTLSLFKCIDAWCSRVIMPQRHQRKEASIRPIFGYINRGPLNVYK